MTKIDRTGRGAKFKSSNGSESMRAHLLIGIGLLAAPFGWPGLAAARTLMVGAEQQYKAPGAALQAAQDSDTIMIQPGTYYDCGFVRANNVTVEGSGPGVVLTDKSCGGKALLVVDGNDITIRNLTLQRARVPDGNGAGIRAEGGNLLVDRTRFLNNQNGILSADNPKATITVKDSEFVGNGVCAAACAHSIYIGNVAKLVVQDTRITETHSGHGIKSRAQRTEVLNCDISDGPTGNSSYTIDIPNGGALVVVGNKLEKGPNAENTANTISIGEEGVDRPTDEIVIKNNRLTNDEVDKTTTFVNNITATPAQLSGNVYVGSVRPLVGDGSQR